MKKNFINLTGFTLVEVMVVVFIITILVSITAISFKSVRVKGRDTKRVDTINTVHQALQAYYNDEGIYPTTLTFGQPLKNILGTKTYLDEVPKNPTPRVDHGCPDSEYIYKVGPNNKSYSLSACIGADNNPNSSKLIYGTQEGIFHCGDTITDRDNFTYKTVSIGSQCWMAENLKTKTTPNGVCINGFRCSNSGSTCLTTADCPTSPVQVCTTSPVITNPDCTWVFSGTPYASSSRLDGRECISSAGTQGTSADCDAGRTLYKIYDALQCNIKPGCIGVQPPNTMCCGTGWVSNQNVQGICPNDWHIPNEAEWATLEQYLSNSGSTCDPNRTGPPVGPYQCATAGTKLKTGGSSGFNAKLIGRRQGTSDSTASCTIYDVGTVALCSPYPPFPNNSKFTSAGSSDWFISAHLDSLGSSSWLRIVDSDTGINRKSLNVSTGRAFSVRCIKN